MGNYGYFDDAKKEYVITNPKTPVKWVNYVGTLDFGGLIDHTGGSIICKGDPAINRIVKYIPQLPSSDFKGETAYVRVKTEDGYKVFSPYFVPTLDDYDKFECHVGLLYTKWVTSFYGIDFEITAFIPTGGTQFIRTYKVTNNSGKDLEIDLIPVVEYTHPDALKQFTNADWIPQTMESKVANEEKDMKVITQYPFMCKDFKVNYFTSNYPVSSFETDRKIFLGDNEYGTWKNPMSLQAKDLSNTEALRGDNICALLHALGTLKNGESKTVITQLGQTDKIENALSDIKKYRDEKNVDAALSEIAQWWDGYLNKMQVKTPDDSMNTMVNIHNPRQCYITKNWSRYLSLYQLGLGARGIGFRDSSQDTMGILGLVPEEGKVLIEKLLKVQKRNGSAMHQFNPITMVANEGDSRDEEDRPDYYGDDHLWIVLAVNAYVKETGNMAFLEKEIPFYEKDKNGHPIEVGTVLEHLKRSIEYTMNDRGSHGLPLLGFADWNDTVNLPKGAESTMIASKFGVALTDMIELMEKLGDTKTKTKYEGYYAEMKKVLNEVAWDGEWYVRYYDQNGNPIGSKINEQGKIYTNAQSWAVFSGFAEGDRALQALDSINTHLNTANGIKLSTPGYNGFDPEKGGVTTYPPGAKENGGIFLHSNPWVMIAETKLGRGEKAFQYYNQINPASKNDKIDEFEVAPYNYPQNILGDEHAQFGLGRNSWLSGTSSWTYQAATKYIIGVRPSYKGLIVDPCIPSDWNEIEVKRFFQDAWYDIKVTNPSNVSKGIKSMMVDGKAVEGNIIPSFKDGKTHDVKVVMG